MQRIDMRKEDALRPIRITPDFMPNAAGSCFIEWGNTRVLVSACVKEGVPPFLAESGKGWVTAEYAMLPGSTGTRKARERGKSDSRSIEIQRLIGRSLRSIVDQEALNGFTVTVDCDVVQADGGTRTASITGGYVALALACKKLMAEGKLEKWPLKKHLAAVSAGVVEGEPILDLCYVEDSGAEADMNFVGDEDGGIAEIQICGEKRTITDEEFARLLALCKQGVAQLVKIQKEVLEDA
ncbi:MAG: ribonuclease PH [Christensenellaceae bacterium]|nr:ribonuclease PH [Christensenellaceae bacterium]